jgi:hypothetical protein
LVLNLAFAQGLEAAETSLKKKLLDQLTLNELLKISISIIEDEISSLIEMEGDFELQTDNRYHLKVMKEKKLQLSKPTTLPLKVRTQTFCGGD